MADGEAAIRAAVASAAAHEPPALDAPDLSEDQLALRFAEKHQHRLRHVAAWGKWFLFDGSTWREDATLMTMSWSRTICRDAAGEAGKRAAVAIGSSKTVAAVVSLARADRRLAATVDQWDTDPLLLNTPGGVVDLRTGDIRPARPED